MAPFRHTVPFVLASILLGAGCATERPGRTSAPPPPTTVLQEVGYREVVQIGQDYAREQGYEVADVSEAVEVRPNYWRVRFGLAPKGSGRLLQIEFDETQRRVVKSTEIGGVAGRVTPSP